MDQVIYDKDGLCLRCRGTNICHSCSGTGIKVLESGQSRHINRGLITTLSTPSKAARKPPAAFYL